MQRSIRILIAALVSAALVGAPVATAAKEGPRFAEDEGKFVLENDHLTVWFQGKKPMLKVFPAATTEGNESAEGYEYRFTSVVEFRDLDGNGAPSESEIVGRLNLNGANAWTVERTETDTAVTLNLTLRDAVKFGAGPLREANLSLGDRTADVTLLFHLSSAPVEIDANGTLLQVPATAIKYDFLVNQWPWVDADAHRLALEMSVTGAMDADLDAAIPEATVETNGTTLGIVSWLPNATATDAAGETFDVPVESYLEVGVNQTRITYVYDAPGIATLLHDPTIGIASAGNPSQTSGLPDVSSIPGPTVLVAAAGLGLAALAMGRRRG